MILFAKSNPTEGLLKGIDRRACWTSWSGSLKKCFATQFLHISIFTFLASKKEACKTDLTCFLHIFRFDYYFSRLILAEECLMIGIAVHIYGGVSIRMPNSLVTNARATQIGDREIATHHWTSSSSFSSSRFEVFFFLRVLPLHISVSPAIHSTRS